MIMPVTCVELKKGNFNKDNKDIAYNNIYIHVLKPVNESSGESFSYGNLPVRLKIKNDVSVIESIFGSRLTRDDLISMLNQSYDFYFDDKGNAVRILEAPAVNSTKDRKGA